MRALPVLACLIVGASALAQMIPADGSRPVGLNASSDRSFKAFVTNPQSGPNGGGDSPERLDPVYDFETVVVGTSKYDLQHQGSYGKMLAITADGVVHGAFTGGSNVEAGRRIRAWCVSPDLSFPNPTENVTLVLSGNVTYAISSEYPPNDLSASTGVPCYHRAAASWFAADFGDCSMAFMGLQHLNGPTILWPHIAIDYQDKVHMVCGDAGTVTPNTMWYDASTTGSSWDGGYNLVSDNCNTLAQTLTARKTEPGVALLFLPEAPASPALYADTTYGAPQWQHDVFLHEATDAANDLHALLNLDVPPVNLTRYNSPECSAPFRFGIYAFADVDAIYESEDERRLHVAFPTPVSFPDTMLWVANGVTHFQPFVTVDTHSAIWHVDAATGQWGHIAGWLTGDIEDDALPSVFAGALRCNQDRVQLAHDPESGHLYALWNVYDKNDLRSPEPDGKAMANGDLFMACSADNGLTWGPRVNITNSPSPGCLSPDCFSETFGSLAEQVDYWGLHLTFLMDKHAGSSILGIEPDDGSLETTNNVYYMRVPVFAVPPNANPATAWDADGHIGFSDYSRPWFFEEGHPDTIRVIDKVSIFNEGLEPRRLLRLTMYHDPLDSFHSGYGDLQVDWAFLAGDPVDPGPWIVRPGSGSDWDGILPAQRVTLMHLSVNHRGLPLCEQAFKFTFDDGTERLYRYKYQGPGGQGSRVEPLDLEHLERYASTLLYDAEMAELPAPRINVSTPRNNIIRISWEVIAQASCYQVLSSAGMGQPWELESTTTQTHVELNCGPAGSGRLFRVRALRED